MNKKRGLAFNSVSGRPKSFANVDMVQSIHIQDQENNLNTFKVKVHMWTTVKELKDKIQAVTGYPAPRQRLFYNNNELENQKTLDFYNLLTKKNVVAMRLKPDIDQLKSYIDVYGSVYLPKKLKKVIDLIRQGFNSGLIPKLTDDGTSGTYEMRNAQKQKVAVFKPIDEEPFAPNNPRGHQGPFGSQTFRPGVLSGESCIREVAAFLLDHKNFSGVPLTTFVEVVHSSLKYVPFTGLEVTSDTYFEIMSSLIRPIEESMQKDDQHNSESLTKTPDSELSTNATSVLKSTQSRIDKETQRIAQENQIGMKFGSLQYFVDSEGPIENYSPDLFHKDEVHKIAILDLRLFNLDRNECNILVTTKTNKKTGKRVRVLIPIDHGLCIPDNLAVCSFDLCWLSWRQAELPFSQRTLNYIQAIDVLKDIKILEKTFKFRPICLRNLRISTTLLQRGASQGLNLAQIGKILCRPDEDDTLPSLLERIVEKARLIADMMWRMQSKIKDTNLRSIDQIRENNKKNKNDKNQDSLYQEDDKDNSPSLRLKRNRTSSLHGISLSSKMTQSQKLNNQLFSSISAALGAENEDSMKFKFEAKQRGMSDVDDTNIQLLKDNTSNMIESQLQRMISATHKGHDLSPSKAQESEESKGENDNSPSDECNQKQMKSDEDATESENEEFFDCLDNQKDLQLIESSVNIKSQSHHQTQLDRPYEKVGGLRRTASYSNIQIQEAADEDEEDEDYGNEKHQQQQISPEKQKLLKLQALQSHERYSNQKMLINGLKNRGGLSSKSYFEHGSIRNTAHDEEFFHCFVNYLDEAIKKMKEQDANEYDEQNEDYDQEECEEME